MHTYLFVKCIFFFFYIYSYTSSAPITIINAKNPIYLAVVYETDKILITTLSYTKCDWKKKKEKKNVSIIILCVYEHTDVGSKQFCV